MRTAPPLALRWRPALLTVAFWVCAGLVFFGGELLHALARGTPLPGLPQYGGNLVWMMTWALCTPLIFAASHRFPLVGADRRSHVAWHAGLCTGIWVLDACSSVAYASLQAGHLKPVLPFLAAGLYASVLMYSAVAAVAHAQRFHRLSVERQVRASALEAQLLRSQLRALQMQMRPHFLFNALHTVSGLIRTGEPRGALEVVANLADLLRTVLKRDATQEVPLWQELELVERYLQIERMRFQERLRASIEVEPATTDALVPQLLLQPLVENAVRHGTHAGGARAEVSVHVTAEDGMLWMRVRDSGDGPSASLVSEPGVPGLSAAEGETGDGARGGGVALSNTRERLRHLYGERHRLELTPAEGGGTLAQVAIPLRRARGEVGT